MSQFVFWDTERIRLFYFPQQAERRLLTRANSQEELMYRMQRIRTMHCVMWTESVLEIVSAENSFVKFILSDHPVTLFNSHVFPSDPRMVWTPC
jgi:hypothetical protein